MNYFEIINAILLELNYSQVSSFDDLTKIEHKRIMDVVNRLNKEVCLMSDAFPFRQMINTMKLRTDKKEYDLPFKGKISKIIGKNEKYQYEPDFGKFFQNEFLSNKFGLYGNKVLFSGINDIVKIFYVSEEFVVDRYGNFKENFVFENDMSIIPANFVERIFVNGGAYNFKQNTAHPKYVHWKKEYDSAIAELVATASKNTGADLKIDGGFRKI